MFENKKFDIEHALHMYADSFSLLPASGIYDDAALKPFMSVIEKCHIYLIGIKPRVDFTGARQSGQTLFVSKEVLGKTYELTWPLPDGLQLKQTDGYWHFVDETGTRLGFIENTEMARKLALTDAPMNFDIQYIGQAYGADGSRNALDRLRKHETLQKIALQGVPDGYRLELILLEVVPGTRVITFFNPRADDKTKGDERLKAGFDKLFGTDEKERVSLFEAAFIRYFRPPFNEKFKDSFPSTNLKVLKDCYDKDFSAVIAEIGFDELPYRLCSGQVAPKDHHTARFNLSTEADRAVFFSPTPTSATRLTKLVNEMSKLTIAEASELSRLLRDTWRAATR